MYSLSRTLTGPSPPMYTESHTDRYFHFHSHHPISHKIAVVRTLNHRAKNLPSTPTVTAEEERRVAQALKKNGYPRKLIEQQTHHSPPPSQGHHPTHCLCNHPICEEHLRNHQKNPHTIRHKDILPANQHPTTGPGMPYRPRAQGEQIRSNISDPMQ